MSRRNKGTPKFAICTTEQRQKALLIFESWNEALKKHTRRTDFAEIPAELKDMEKRVSPNSLASCVCAWIEQTPEWDRLWEAVVGRVETTKFLNSGYNDFTPTLAWLFAFENGSRRNIDKVIEGRYDSWKTGHSRFYGNEAV